MRVSKIWVLYVATGALVLFVVAALAFSIVAKKRAGQLHPPVAEATTEAPLPSPPPPPAPPVSPATLSKLFDEAEKAFTTKNYPEAANKLTELLKLCGNRPEYPIELLMFNVGLAYFLDEKMAEAEKAFDACAKKFPKGEYTSRCHLGIGKAALAQGGKDKQELAIESFKKAAADPKLLTDASLPLAQLYLDRGQLDTARATLRPLMTAEIRTVQQATAAVEVIGLLGENDFLDELGTYLKHLRAQPGVRNAIAWFSNQVAVKGDAMASAKKWEAALATFNAILPRAEILEIQKASLATQREELAALKQRGGDRMKLAEAVQQAEAVLKSSEEGQAAIEGMKDFDAALVMRRGRSCYYLDRDEEAAKAFAEIREKYPQAADAQMAAYSEIVLHHALKNQAKVRTLAEAFLTKYPQAVERDKVKEMKEE